MLRQLERLTRRIGIVGAVLEVILIAYLAHRSSWAPLKPDLSHGLVVPYDNHGTTVYISFLDGQLSSLLFFGALVILAAFVIGMLLERAARTSKDDN